MTPDLFKAALVVLKSLALPDRVAVLQEQLDLLTAATQTAMEDGRDADLVERSSRPQPGDVYAYFNNDWEGLAIANARTLRSFSLSRLRAP